MNSSAAGPVWTRLWIPAFAGMTVLFAFCPLPCLWAGGLSTPFVDVQVEKVRVGKSFPVTHSSAEGLALLNLGPTPLRVRVDVFPPAATDLRRGAEPIPDVSWIRVEPSQFVVPPYGRFLCRVTLRVPAEKKFRRKYYQAMIWSHTEPASDKSVALNAGLVSRLRFRTQ